MAEKTRYSDAELEEFRAIIMEKLELAQRDYDQLKMSLMGLDGNDTDDTSPTYKVLEEGANTLSKEETTRYLECLLKVRKGEIQPQTIPNTCALSLNSLDETALEKRFQLLTNKSSKRSFSSILLIVGSLTIFILSYAFTLKAHAVPANTDTCKYFTLTSENAYAISRDDGTVDLYLYGEFLENVDSLTYYDSSLPIYSETEVLP